MHNVAAVNGGLATTRRAEPACAECPRPRTSGNREPHRRWHSFIESDRKRRKLTTHHGIVSILVIVIAV
jgi:hypothetical protein